MFPNKRMFIMFQFLTLFAFALLASGLLLHPANVETLTMINQDAWGAPGLPASSITATHPETPGQDLEYSLRDN